MILSESKLASIWKKASLNDLVSLQNSATKNQIHGFRFSIWHQVNDDKPLDIYEPYHFYQHLRQW